MTLRPEHEPNGPFSGKNAHFEGLINLPSVFRVMTNAFLEWRAKRQTESMRVRVAGVRNKDDAYDIICRDPLHLLAELDLDGATEVRVHRQLERLRAAHRVHL
jgi:hypothetical protein